MITVDGVEVRNGEKKSLEFEVCKQLDGRPMIVPYTVICGAEDGPVLLLDGCVHGDEPEGAIAIIRLMNELDPAKLKGTVICCPAVNVEGLAAMRRGNPRDELSYDMNRIYPGVPKGGFLTQRVANRHYQTLLKVCDLEINLHGGGNHSFMTPTIFNSGIPESMELAKAMGEDWKIINTSLGDASPTGQARMLGKGAITAEIGGTCGTIPELLSQTIATIMKAFYNVMYYYGMLEGTPTRCKRWWVGHQETIFAEASGLINPVYDWTLGKMLQPGDPIAQLVNLRGEVVQEAVAPCVGIPFGIHTYPSVTTGDWMCFFGAGEWQYDE